MTRPTHTILASILACLMMIGIAACRPKPQSEVGPIAPVSYEMPNGDETFFGFSVLDETYGDGSQGNDSWAFLHGGLGQLADGELPTSPSLDSSYPWVGWKSSDPNIRFQFEEAVRIETVRIHLDPGQQTGSSIDVDPPESVQLTAGGVSVTIPVESGSGAPFTLEIPDLALEGATVDVKLRRSRGYFNTTGWVVVGELEFDGFVLPPPPPPTVMDVVHKASQVVFSAMLNDQPQEVTIDFDSTVVQQQADAMVAEQGLEYETAAVRAVKAQGFASLRQQVWDELAHPGITIVHEYENLPSAVVHVDGKDALFQLLLRPEVTRAYEEEEFEIQLTQSLPQIGQDLVAVEGWTGAGVTVAVLDTGVDWTHPDFGGCTDVGQPASCRVIEALDIREDDQLDDNGHGTNVSAIVAGVAPGADLIVLDVFKGATAPSGDIAYAIDWLILNRDRWNLIAVNMSLGSTKGTFNGCDRFDSHFAELRRAGVVPIISSGNDSAKDALGTPACSMWAVSVGNVTTSDVVNMTSNSHFGLDILAPGTMVTAAGITMTGTSQAAPHVAGALAVLRERFPDKTIDELVVALQGSGVPVVDPGNGLSRPRIQLDAAVDFSFVWDEMEPEDRFGEALAAGDFDGDGYQDMAVGVPGEDSETGKVHIFYGTPNGLSNARNSSRDGNHSRWGEDFSGGGIGAREPMDWFGTALAAGDFDGDGYDDLAIGVPGEDVTELPEFDTDGSGTSNTYYQAGAVKLFYGTSGGLSSRRFKNVTRFSPGVAGPLAHGAFFGQALVADDFDADGYVDLAVGAPGDAVNSQAGAGSLTLVMGSPDGLTGYGGVLLHQSISGTPGNAEAYDNYASALASGDIDGDGYADLVIGVAQEDIGSVPDAGYVNIAFGSALGLSGRYGEFHQDLAGVVGNAETGDLLGYSLAVGDFDNDGYDDVAMGMPGEEFDGKDLAGQVIVAPGSPAGLVLSESRTWRQGKDGLAESLESDDQFGFALLAGEFDGDAYDDLVISVPGEDKSGNDAGVVHVLHGSSAGLDTQLAMTDELWHQDGASMLERNDPGDEFGTALAAGDFDGNGHLDLAVGIPGENPRRLCSTVCGIGTNSPDAGAAIVLYGDTTPNSSGLGTGQSQLWSQDR